MNLIKAFQLAGDLQRVADILNPANGDLRWTLLQQWLDVNPRYRETLNQCLDITPPAAFRMFLESQDIDYDAIRFLDRDGQVEAKAISTIQELQTLYKERAGISPRRLHA